MVLKSLAALKVSEEGLDKRHKHRRLLIKQKKQQLQHHFLFLTFSCSGEIADDCLSGQQEHPQRSNTSVKLRFV